MFRLARKLQEPSFEGPQELLSSLCLYAFETRTFLWSGHGTTGYRMLLEHERYQGLGMDALLLALTRTNLRFGHGCAASRMLLERTRTDLWSGHRCAGYRLSYALGTGTLF